MNRTKQNILNSNILFSTLLFGALFLLLFSCSSKQQKSEAPKEVTAAEILGDSSYLAISYERNFN